MRKRLVDAYFRDGSVRSYPINLRLLRIPLTDEECIGIAKQYHAEDRLPLEAVDRWVVRPISDSGSSKSAEPVQR